MRKFHYFSSILVFFLNYLKKIILIYNDEILMLPIGWEKIIIVIIVLILIVTIVVVSRLELKIERRRERERV